MSSFAAGQKRPAEGRIDRDGTTEAETVAAQPRVEAATAAPVTLVKANRPDAPAAANPFKGLATTNAATPAAPGFSGFGSNNGAAPTGGFSFGAFGTGAPTAAETAGATAASKFSFSFGAPAATTTTAATPIPTPAFSFGAPPASGTATAAPQTFSFNFNASNNKPTAGTAPSAPAAQGTSGPGFNFGAKYDFTAGVKAFAASQTTRKEEPEEEEDPEAEVPITSAPHIANALSAAPVKRETEGNDTDNVLLEVPHVKVFLQGTKENVEQGKLVATTEKEWKERGAGTLKVSSFNLNGEVRHRLVMHSEQTKQLVLNVNIDKWFAVVASTEKTVAFRTVVVEAGKPKAALYNLRVPEANVKALVDKLSELAPKKV